MGLLVSPPPPYNVLKLARQSCKVPEKKFSSGFRKVSLTFHRTLGKSRRESELILKYWMFPFVCEFECHLLAMLSLNWCIDLHDLLGGLVKIPLTVSRSK